MIVAKFDTTKTASGSSSTNQLQLLFTNSGSYNCTVDWGDGSADDTITTWNQAETLHTYASAGEYTVTITGPCPGFQTFNSIDKTKLTEVVSFDCGLVGRNNMSSTFRDATNLVAGGSVTNTSSVTSFAYCWQSCSSMTLPPDTSNWDTSAVTSFNRCWQSCPSMTLPPDTSNWDTSAVTTFFACWYNCPSMTLPPDTSNWDTSAVTTFQSCWYNCSFEPRDYDALLIGLAGSSPRSNVPMHGGSSSKYTYHGKPSRDKLLLLGWTITDGGQDLDWSDPDWPDPRFTGIGRQRRLGEQFTGIGRQRRLGT